MPRSIKKGAVTERRGLGATSDGQGASLGSQEKVRGERSCA